MKLLLLYIAFIYCTKQRGVLPQPATEVLLTATDVRRHKSIMAEWEFNGIVNMFDEKILHAELQDQHCYEFLDRQETPDRQREFMSGTWQLYREVNYPPYQGETNRHVVWSPAGAGRLLAHYQAAGFSVVQEGEVVRICWNEV